MKNYLSTIYHYLSKGITDMKTEIQQLKTDMQQILAMTETLEKQWVQRRVKVNNTNYLIRLKKLPSISYNGFQYVGPANGFYIYQQIK